MTLNDVAGGQGIYQDIDFTCGTDTTTFPLNDKKRLVNQWYQYVQHWIFNATGRWDVQQNIMTIDLIAGQRDYVFPTALIEVKKVQVKIENTYQPCDIIDERSIEFSIVTEQEIISAFNNTRPKCVLYNDSIKIYSGPINNNVTDGIYVWGRVYNAALSADGDIPGFATAFHKILSFGPSWEFSTKQDASEFNANIRRQLGKEVSPNSGIYDGLIGQLQRYYANRILDNKCKIQPLTEIYI